MASANPLLEQVQASQKQMLDSFVEAYEKMILAFTPENSLPRAMSELNLDYFKRMREVMALPADSESPQAMWNAAMEGMKKSSEVNLDFSNRVMSLYRDFLAKYGMGSAN
jgi:hypothetical protein